MWCYTLLSLSLIGIPPFGGFFSKWYIAEGALKALSAPLSYIVPAALLLSALYTAGYLLPISTRGFFPGEDVKVKKEKEPIAFIIPLVILAAIALAGGLFTPSAVNAISAFTSNLI
jgi:multicomponent Na+:H+ antiporter subunit D